MAELEANIASFKTNRCRVFSTKKDAKNNVLFFLLLSRDPTAWGKLTKLVRKRSERSEAGKTNEQTNK